MKRFIFLIILIISIFICTNAFSAGSVTQTVEDVFSYDFEHNKIGFRTLTFACVGDSSNGSIPDTATSTANTGLIQGWYLIKVLIIPSTPSPTDNSDVYVKDENGIDLLGAGGENLLDSSGAQEIYPLLATKGAAQPIIGALTLDVDGNSAASNQYSIVLVFSKYPLSVNGLT